MVEAGLEKLKNRAISHAKPSYIPNETPRNPHLFDFIHVITPSITHRKYHNPENYPPVRWLLDKNL